MITLSFQTIRLIGGWLRKAAYRLALRALLGVVAGLILVISAAQVLYVKLAERAFRNG